MVIKLQRIMEKERDDARTRIGGGMVSGAAGDASWWGRETDKREFPTEWFGATVRLEDGGGSDRRLIKAKYGVFPAIRQ